MIEEQKNEVEFNMNNVYQQYNHIKKLPYPEVI